MATTANPARKRTDAPVFLNGATRLDDAFVADPSNLFRLLRSKPEFWLQLQQGTDMTQEDGRPRIGGEWSLMFLAYALSGQRDIRRWHLTAPNHVWRAAGFASKPNYWTTYNNFVGLEAHADAFRETAARCIRQAVAASGGLVGRDVHVDGTEAETNARLHHDCQRGEGCRREHPEKKVGQVAARVSADVARKDRQDTAARPPEEVGDLLIGDAVELIADTRGHRIKTAKGCYYRSADKDAGIRAYGRNGRSTKFWHGFNNLKGIDHYTGGVLATHSISASVNESKGYIDLLEGIIANTGVAPRAVVGDKGFSVAAVFEANTTRGIASVFPYRRHGSEPERRDHERFDRYGIPYCRHCGASSRFVRFHTGDPDKPRPRLWFHCSAETEAACARHQTILCKESWRHLLPLWRDTEAYFALRDSHTNYERRHHEWRDRYLVAGDNHQTRPRRRGLPWQTLRANAALLIEWLGILDREGWMGARRKNEADARPRDGGGALDSFKRRWHGLGLYLGKNINADYAYGVVIAKECDLEAEWWPPDDRYI